MAYAEPNVMARAIPVMTRPAMYMTGSVLTAVSNSPIDDTISEAIKTPRRPSRSASTPPEIANAASANVDTPAARAWMDAVKLSSSDALTSAREDTMGSAT